MDVVCISCITDLKPLDKENLKNNLESSTQFREAQKPLDSTSRRSPNVHQMRLEAD